jgi:hypothetical protein
VQRNAEARAVAQQRRSDRLAAQYQRHFVLQRNAGEQRQHAFECNGAIRPRQECFVIGFTKRADHEPRPHVALPDALARQRSGAERRVDAAQHRQLIARYVVPFADKLFDAHRNLEVVRQRAL